MGPLYSKKTRNRSEAAIAASSCMSKKIKSQKKKIFASHPSLASVVVECPPLWSENRMVARTRNNSVWSLPLLKTKMMRFRDLTSITYPTIISNKKRVKWQQKTTNATKLQNCLKRKSSRSHCNSGARPCSGMKMMNSMRISLMS